MSRPGSPAPIEPRSVTLSDPTAPSSASPTTAATYGSAGVDLDAAADMVRLLRPVAGTTHRSEVLDGIGGFASLFALAIDRYRYPVLAACTDGVGTKALIARDLGRFDTVGLDLVAMCIDDLICQGAEPLFMLDYIAVGHLDRAQVIDLVTGVAEGCRLVGAALVGGETAEHAGVLGPGEFDIVGFAVGVVERDEVLGAGRVRVGDTLIGFPSPGLRSNGYTLARHVLCERAGLPLAGPAWPGAAATLGDELLRPSVIYTPAVQAAMAVADVHAVAHITGGGLPGNLPRVLPDDTRAVLDRGTWEVPRIFSEIQRLGEVTEAEMARVFNLGLGMVLVIDRDTSDAAIAAASSLGIDARVIGHVEAAESKTSPAGATGAGGEDEDRLVFTGPTFWLEDGGPVV